MLDNAYMSLQKLAEELSAHRVMNAKNDFTKMQYRDDEGTNVLTVGKKEFTHIEHQTKFKESWVRFNEHNSV